METRRRVKVYCGLRDEIVVTNCKVRKCGNWDVGKKIMGSEMKLLWRTAGCGGVGIQIWNKRTLWARRWNCCNELQGEELWALRCGEEDCGLRDEIVVTNWRVRRCGHSDVEQKNIVGSEVKLLWRTAGWGSVVIVKIMGSEMKLFDYKQSAEFGHRDMGLKSVRAQRWNCCDYKQRAEFLALRYGTKVGCGLRGENFRTSREDFLARLIFE
jgi:hypothetical protein